MLLNFRIRKLLKFFPTRSCRKNTGTPESKNTNTDSNANRGAEASRIRPLIRTSMTRLDDICRLLRVCLPCVVRRKQISDGPDHPDLIGLGHTRIDRQADRVLVYPRRFRELFGCQAVAIPPERLNVQRDEVYAGPDPFGRKCLNELVPSDRIIV